MDSYKEKFGKRKRQNTSVTVFHLFLLFLLLSSSLFAQVSFDVKTAMEEKQQFHGYLINTFVPDFITEMNRQPTPLESYEANLLAAKAVVE